MTNTRLPLEMVDKETDGPVTCLGITFGSDEERMYYDNAQIRMGM